METDWKTKLTSRKWWMAVVTAAAALVAAVSGYAAEDAVVQAVGVVCAVACATVYQLVEGRVDVARIEADQTVTTKTVTASASDKATVQAVMGTTAEAKAEE